MDEPPKPADPAAPAPPPVLAETPASAPAQTAPPPAAATKAAPGAHAERVKRGMSAMDKVLGWASMLGFALIHALYLSVLDRQTRNLDWRKNSETVGVFYIMALTIMFVLPGAMLGWYFRGKSFSTRRWLGFAVPYWLTVAALFALMGVVNFWMVIIGVVLALGAFFFLVLILEKPGGRIAFGHRKRRIDVSSPATPFSHDGLGTKDPRSRP